jgi:hypothetical protein
MTVYSSEEQISFANGNYLVNTPMLWVNTYVQEKIAEYTSSSGNDGVGIPFFPPSPNTLDDLTETWIVLNDTRFPYAGVRCTYDRLTRLRRSPFPHIKGEQLLYYFYATAEGVTDKMIAVTETVLRLMDREDETAEEINNWSKGKVLGGFSPKFYFHKFRVYQLEEVADIIDFGTARTYGGNKIIIEYEYHLVPDLNPDWNDPKYTDKSGSNVNNGNGYTSLLPYDPNKYLPVS